MRLGAATPRKSPRRIGWVASLLGVCCLALPFGPWGQELGGPAPVLVGLWTSDACVVRFRGTGAFSLTRVKDGKLQPPIEGEYVLNTSKRPMALSLRGMPGSASTVHTSVRFDGDRILHVAQFSPVWRLRPLTFGGPGSLRLHRESH